MKFLIMPNLEKNNILYSTSLICSKLQELGCGVMFDNRFREVFKDESYIFDEFETLIEMCDIVIAIGGDGTILHSAKHSAKHEKPLLGINLGRLGYLAGLEISQLNLLENLVNKSYKLDKRRFLEVTHIDKNNVSSKYFALNDVVISNGEISKIVDLKVFSNDKFVATYRADGVIISTPTGSTAYALSAGGPIIEPSVECISLTPICAHSLVARTIMFDKESTLSVCHNDDNIHPVYMTIDGEAGRKINSEDIVYVKMSSIQAKLIKLDNRSFYEVLAKKLT